MSLSFKFLKRKADTLIQFDNPRDLFHPEKKSESIKWLFFTPYDYDAIIGAGMMIQAAVKNNIKISVVIVTDGAQGYASENDKNEIIEIRRKETILSYFSLGIKDVQNLNFPDSNLHYFVGRAQAADEEEEFCVINGYSGLQNVLVYHIRSFKPDLIFVGNRNEFQPEYRILFQESLFSIFNASRRVWPELGDRINYIPKLVEFPIFRHFSKTPNIQLQSVETAKNKKLDALKYFISQKQIEPLIELIKVRPMEEYFCEADCSQYNPEAYRSLFKEH